uniref:DUF3951 domain-containing protein n=1 Tax=Strongyloides venezuelensis TaxID=75913 RepID=A0A0K0EWQ9_STRVS
MIFAIPKINITNNEHIIITLLFFIIFGLIGYIISQYYQKKYKKRTYLIQPIIVKKHVPGDYQLFSIESVDDKYEAAWR